MWRAVALLAVLVLVVSCSSEGDDGGLSIDEARAFADFELYYVGDEFDGLELSAIHRRVTEPYSAGLPGRANYVSFKYGDCAPSGDGGCPAPLEIQVWRLCERNPSLYSLTPSRLHTVRGAPAASYGPLRDRLEVYAGQVTVVLFSGPARARRAARSLRGLNNGAGADDPLPPPPEGALEQGLAC